MHMTCAVVMKNEYTNVCSKRLQSLNFQLLNPHVKTHAKILKPLVYIVAMLSHDESCNKKKCYHDLEHR